MRNEIRTELKPKIDAILRNALLNTHGKYKLKQRQLSLMLELSDRACSALESGKYGFSLETFLFFLAHCSDNPIALITDLVQEIDKVCNTPPELIISREWMNREMRWTKKSVQRSPVTDRFTCPHCGAPVIQDFQNFCGNCAQALNWSEAFPNNVPLDAKLFHT